MCCGEGKRKAEIQSKNGREVAENYSEKDREQEYALGNNGQNGGGVPPNSGLSAAAML